MSFDPSIFKILAKGERPTPEIFEAAMISILRGDVTDGHVTALLIGLEMIGITSRELRIGAKVMRDNMLAVNIPFEVMDIVGTGGTGLQTFSISTATALVCAGAGVKIAKHGNRAASSLAGTADTLSELGINLAITPEKTVQCLEDASIGFLFAPNHHKSMRHVAFPRKTLGIRTLFNLLGPLCNPAGAKRILLGVNDQSWCRPMAEALQDLGVDHAWVVHGVDGMDEITTTGVTSVCEVKCDVITEFTISPTDFGIPTCSLGELRGGGAAENAKALVLLLDGKLSAYRDIVTLNAGAALMISGVAPTVEIGIEMAKSSIDSGQTKRSLNRLIEVSNT